MTTHAAPNAAADPASAPDTTISQEPWEGSRTLPRRTALGQPSSVHAEQPTDLELGFMRRALAAAEEAAGRGEVPVGAVVVLGDRIVSVAHNERETGSD